MIEVDYFQLVIQSLLLGLINICYFQVILLKKHIKIRDKTSAEE